MNLRPFPRARRILAASIAGILALQSSGVAVAAILQSPVLFAKPPASNVMVGLDDSNSMRANAEQFFATGYGAAYIPIGYASTDDLARESRSPDTNPLYYNPAIQYQPWPDVATTPTNKRRRPNATPSAVIVDASLSTPGSSAYVLDITRRVVTLTATGGQPAVLDESNSFWPATYYLKPDDPANFIKTEIQPGRPLYPLYPNRRDCIATAGSCTYTEEIQNFANYLQYYSTRMKMAIGAIAGAFADQGEDLRVGIRDTNGSLATTVATLRPFSGAGRREFFRALTQTAIPGGGTPLRAQLDSVGQYFRTTGPGNPWADDIATGTTIDSDKCRKSYFVMATDGAWNDQGANVAAPTEGDSLSGQTPSTPSGTSYIYGDTPPAGSTDPLASRFTVNPFASNATGTLSDIAAYYWSTDLQPGLDNAQIPSSRDPAFWQHLTTFTFAMGLATSGTTTRASDGSAAVPAGEPASSPYAPFAGKGWLSSQALRDALVEQREPMKWAPTGNDAAGNVDDLVHAAMASRGRYFEASDPATFAAQLSSVLGELGSRPDTAANIAITGADVSTTSSLYQGQFNPFRWAGRLYAYGRDATGQALTSPAGTRWEASAKMPAPNARYIYTWAGAAGAEFRASALTGQQKGALGAANTRASLVDYLRGDDSHEVSSGGTWRDRQRAQPGVAPLGDIVNSSPVIPAPTGGDYATQLPPNVAASVASAYSSYRSTTSSSLTDTLSTIFVGANDGMLHAFDLNSGVERFAYVPNSVFRVPRSPTGTENKLAMLADPQYEHRYTVDGPPQVADAYLNGSWKTLLVSSTGAGSRGLFALDVSQVNAAGSRFGPGNVLWDIDETTPGAQDLGHVLAYPHVVMTSGGKFVAITGNGYDSASGRAALLVIDLANGAILATLAVGGAPGNGLSQPNFVVDNTRAVKAIYSGDLQGNLWKFDASNPNPANWSVAYGGSPLYAGSATQPITVMPEISSSPNGGFVISFGTGKMFEASDIAHNATNVNLNAQAIIGVYDRPLGSGRVGKGTLVTQSLNTALTAAANTALAGTTANKVDYATKDGWYLELPAGGNGERVVQNPLQVKNTLLVTSANPDVLPCNAGGSSRLFALDPLTGGAPSFGVFDADNNGGISSSDKGYNVWNFSASIITQPAVSSPTPQSSAVSTVHAESRGQTGTRAGGVQYSTAKATNCSKVLTLNASGAAVSTIAIKTCASGIPRVSWRQIK